MVRKMVFKTGWNLVGIKKKTLKGMFPVQSFNIDSFLYCQTEFEHYNLKIKYLEKQTSQSRTPALLRYKSFMLSG